MGSKNASLGDVLFTKTQRRVLGLLFGDPNRSFYTNEIVRFAGMGIGAVQRELQRLESAQLVTTTKIGNQKHYQANRDAAIYEELRGIVVKTFGVADPLRAALTPLRKHIHTAFLFGSVGKGTDTARSDDLAYNALHALALAALRWHGYRSDNRYLVFRCLPLTA